MSGGVYASELSLHYLSQPPAPGRIVRIGENGANEAVVDGLPSPSSITFDRDGNLYVVVNPTSPPGATPSGLLLRCAAITHPSGMTTQAT